MQLFSEIFTLVNDNIIYAYNEKWINVTNQYSPLCTTERMNTYFNALYVLLSGSNDKNNLTSQYIWCLLVNFHGRINLSNKIVGTNETHSSYRSIYKDGKSSFKTYPSLHSH